MKCTLQDIAKKAGVSVSTVSLALRDDARISARTKKRVLEAARALHYQRDPLLGKLMTHLRGCRESSYRGEMVGLYCQPASSRYGERLIEAAAKQADLMGYRFTLQEFPWLRQKREALHAVLLSRGVEALLILPSDIPLDLQEGFDWESFSVVAAAQNPYRPDVDRVTSNWFHAIRLSISELRSLGFSRLGFLVGLHFDFVCRHLITTALDVEFDSREGDRIPPFFYTLPHAENIPVSQAFVEYLKRNRIHCLTKMPLDPLPGSLLAWCRQFEPEVLVVDREETALFVDAYLKAEYPRPVAIVTLSRSAVSPYAGVVLPAEEVGARATEYLDRKVRKGLLGTSSAPIDVLYRGYWAPPS